MIIDIKKLLPKFITDDKNGYALASAIHVGLQCYIDIYKNAVEGFVDVDKMSESRLDELAREYGCLYNYNADLSMKRHWIKNAIVYQMRYGTVQALIDYIGAYYDDFTVEEYNVIGGTPFHFSITTYSDVSDDKLEWMRNAVNTAKNLRSLFDGFSRGSVSEIIFSSIGEIVGQSIDVYSGTFECGEATFENGGELL